MAEKMKGLNQVLSNLSKEGKKIEGKTMKGLLRSAILIRRDMDRTPPLIPVDIGNLRASWFVLSHYMSGRKAAVTIGFTAEYAFVVHENVNPKVQWKRPNSGPKFLEASLKRNFKIMLGILASEAKKQ